MEKYITNSVEETEAVAAKFAQRLSANDIVAYKGSMGMGKTAFTRGIIKGLGGEDVVSSPTFALVNEYQTPKLTVYHFDMYRVTGWNDLYSTGFFDYIDSNALLIIEWSENIENALPDDIYTVEITSGDIDEQRNIHIYGKEK